jgi:uncharacterized membrane protein
MLNSPKLTMREGNEPIVFHARLTPNPPLSKRGFAVLIGLMLAVSLAVSVPFALLGAWPVAGFLGLDVIGLWFALRISSARARTYEDIVLTRIELVLRKVTYKGASHEWRFNPLWVRLERRDHVELGTEHLALLEAGRRVEMGRFLGPEDKADFAGALTAALATVKRG